MATEPMRLLNVKVPAWLRELVEEAVAASDLPDLSKWVREALEAGARAELEAVRTPPGRTPADGAAPIPSPSRSATLGVHRRANVRGSGGGCVHPSTARVQKVEAEVCGLCHVVTRWRI